MTDITIPSIDRIKADFVDLVCLEVHKTVRNKRAIDLHVRVDRAIDAHTSGKAPLSREDAETLNEINDWILSEVFNITPRSTSERT